MDANTVLRAAAAGNLTADETLTAFAIGPMKKPLYLHTIVPSVSSGDKFAPIAKFEKADSTVLLTITGPDITAAGHYVMAIFSDNPNITKLVVVDDVTLDSTAAGSFGAVIQYLSPARET